MLKAIFFDAVGTLIYLPRSVGEHYCEVGTHFGLEVEAAALEKAFRTEWAASPARVSGTGPRVDDDKNWWRDLVARVLRRTLSDKQRASFDRDGYFEAVYAHFCEPGVWAAFPETVDVLNDLQQRGLKLGVISNFDRRLYQVFSNLELTGFFSSMTISSEIGADKPDPTIFRYALNQLGISALEAMHVGDDPKCDGGATVVGLRLFQLERPHHTLWDLLSALEA